MSDKHLDIPLTDPADANPATEYSECARCGVVHRTKPLFFEIDFWVESEGKRYCPKCNGLFVPSSCNVCPNSMWGANGVCLYSVPTIGRPIPRDGTRAKFCPRANRSPEDVARYEARRERWEQLSCGTIPQLLK